MLREDLKKLKTEPADLRRFGLTVGTVFLLLGCWSALRHKPAWPALIIPAILLLGLGASCPRRLRTVYIAWMTLAFVLGNLTAAILLTLLFFLVVTPMGLLGRCLGKDFLQRKRDPAAASYWVLRDPAALKQKRDYDQQF